MTDHTPDGLIHSPSGLLPVPILARKALICLFVLQTSAKATVKIVFLEDDLWIRHLWVGDTNHYHTAGGIVRKVETFGDAASAHTHQDGSTIVVRLLS